VEEKKERTIEKARDYFHKYWYRKTSLSDLIDEIGISKPTFYNYFKNKEELFKMVMVNTYNEFQYEFNQKARKSTSSMEKLDIFVRTYSWFLDTYPLFRDLYKPGNDLLPRWLKSRISKDLFAEGLAIIRSIIEQGLEEGIFRQNLDITASSLMIYQVITLLLSNDPNDFRKNNGPEYLIDIDTLIKMLGEGLIVKE
jgi:AcrR family transcriptional regulator